MRDGREREATLAVVGEEPARTADRIAGLRSLDGLRLEPLEARELDDVYLDRPGGLLQQRGLALRLRRAGDGSPRLAVKGDARPLPGGGVDRLELEAPWGREALEGARRALEGAGLPAEMLPRDPGGEPVEALRATGWRVLQARTTVRRPRRLGAAAGGEGSGELVVDEVRFRPEGQLAVHREVEVECGSDDRLPSRATRALRARFGEELRRWDHSKLATGRALEALLADGDPGLWVGPDGSLLARVYDRLEELLAGG